MTFWQQWNSQPQTLWVRKAVFQIHLWSGIGIGLYILMISVTGSILVYRNELYSAATPPSIVIAPSGARLTHEELKAAANRAYPGYAEIEVRDLPSDQPAAVELDGAGGHKKRYFNPYTGEDIGDASVPLGIRLVSGLLRLHDDLLGGGTGRAANGVGGFLIIVLVLTGMVVWWPGIKSWKQSLIVHRNAGWRRFMWELHSMLGFWTLVIVLLFGLSGMYLCFPQAFQSFLDWLQPPNDSFDPRFVDSVSYWLAYLHFGRINGIGIPCNGPGLCDQVTKFVWAAAGLVPAAMFITGAVMWWNRVLRKRLRRTTP